MELNKPSLNNPPLNNSFNPELNIILANFVYIFHISIILFVLAVPICNISSLLVLHVSLCISLLIHWWANSDVCSLSIIESNLRGIPYNESFTHKFVSPMYNITQGDWSKFCYIIVISLLSISIYKIYISGRCSETINLYNKLKDKNLPSYKIYIRCFQKFIN